MYIAGTEDGHIYKCSTSYSEQYLETYSGHLGPVYRVQWSPFQSNLFISSSADWSVKLWTEGKVSALAVCQHPVHALQIASSTAKGVFTVEAVTYSKLNAIAGACPSDIPVSK